MMLKRFAVPVIAGAMVLAACDTGEQQSWVDSPVEDSLDGATAPTPGVLASINRSGVRGTARITREADDVIVVVEAEGLEAGSRYDAQLHEGLCADGGPAVLALGRMTGGDDGTASLRFRAASDRLADEENVFVQVNAAGDSAVACANVESAEQGS